MRNRNTLRNKTATRVRYRIFCKEDYIRFLECLRKSLGNIHEAAKASGFRGRNDIINRMKNNPWLADKVKETIEDVLAEATDKAQTTVIRRLKNEKTAKWWLLHQKKAKERGFAKRVEQIGELQIEGSVNLSIREQADKLKNLSKKDLRTLMELYEKAGLTTEQKTGT